MKQPIERKVHEIDAAGQAVGRVATAAVTILIGKHKPDYTPGIDTGDMLTIRNVGQVNFTGRKLVQKDYYHHSMYPGGLKRVPMQKVFLKDPGEVMRHAIYGMIPKNRWRDELMKRLTIVV